MSLSLINRLFASKRLFRQLPGDRCGTDHHAPEGALASDIALAHAGRTFRTSTLGEPDAAFLPDTLRRVERRFSADKDEDAAKGARADVRSMMDRPRACQRDSLVNQRAKETTEEIGRHDA